MRLTSKTAVAEKTDENKDDMAADERAPQNESAVSCTTDEGEPLEQAGTAKEIGTLPPPETNASVTTKRLEKTGENKGDLAADGRAPQNRSATCCTTDE